MLLRAIGAAENTYSPVRIRKLNNLHIPKKDLSSVGEVFFRES
jgi:hypothetical protein